MRKKSIVLVNTPYSNEFGESNPELDPKMPLGLMYLAAHIRNHNFPVRILDANMEKLSVDEIITDIQQKPCDVVGLNVLASNVDTAISIANSLHRLEPKTRVLLGGIHASVAYSHILSSCKAIDACVIGEGELTLLNYLTEDNKELVDGLAYRDHRGMILVSKQRTRIKHLDSLSFPAWDLIPIKKYLSHNGRISVMASRGCPYNCNFCTSRSLWHSKMSWRSPQNVVEELNACAEKYKVNAFHFLDDNFLCWPGLYKFNHIMMSEEFNWRCIGRIERITEKLAINLKMAGCDSITFGIETGIPRLQQEIGKKLDLQNVPTALSICTKAGLSTKAYFMLGFPSETFEELDATIKFAQTLREFGLTDAMFLPVVPYKGTKLYDEVKREKGDDPNLGRISIRSTKDTFGLTGRALRNFRKCSYYPTISASYRLTGKELVTYIAKAYRIFYGC